MTGAASASSVSANGLASMAPGSLTVGLVDVLPRLTACAGGHGLPAAPRRRAGAPVQALAAGRGRRRVAPRGLAAAGCRRLGVGRAGVLDGVLGELRVGGLGAGEDLGASGLLPLAQRSTLAVPHEARRMHGKEKPYPPLIDAAPSRQAPRRRLRPGCHDRSIRKSWMSVLGLQWRQRAPNRVELRLEIHRRKEVHDRDDREQKEERSAAARDPCHSAAELHALAGVEH